MIVIKSIRIFDFEQYIEDGFIVFDKTIIKKGPMTEFFEYLNELVEQPQQIIDGKGRLATPGLVNGHAHVYSTFARGLLLPFNPVTFEDILKQMWWKLDGHLNLDDVYYSGITSGVEFLRNGVTTVIDHHASGVIRGSLNQLKKSMVDEIGLRSILCFEASDRFDIQKCYDENVEFYESVMADKQEDIASMMGLHASFTLSDKSLELLAQSPEDMPIHVHVAESVEDVNHGKLNYGMSIIDRFDKFNLLRKDSIYGHCLYLEDQDLLKIKNTGGNIAINPTSNMNNGVGMPNVARLEALNIPFFTGTDGLGYSMTKDLYNTYFLGHLKHPMDYSMMQFIESMDRLYTYSSKQFGVKLGRLEEGYAADILLHSYNSITPMNEDNAKGHFVFGLLERFAPEYVISKGVIRIENNQFTKDMNSKLVEAKEQAKDLWHRIG